MKVIGLLLISCNLSLERYKFLRSLFWYPIGLHPLLGNGHHWYKYGWFGIVSAFWKYGQQPQSLHASNWFNWTILSALLVRYNLYSLLLEIPASFLIILSISNSSTHEFIYVLFSSKNID